MLPALGLDVSKSKVDVALLVDGKLKHKKITNNPAGFDQLALWLTRQKVDTVHACLESTGSYSEALAIFLADQGHDVSLVNPARVKGFAQSEMVRTKTDKNDASVIARFCQALNPSLWMAPAPEIRELQALVRRLDALQGMLGQETNRLDVAEDIVKSSIDNAIDHLKAQIKELTKQINDHIERHPQLKDQKDLLVSIPGISDKTSALLLAETRDISGYCSARQLAAYAGVSPRQHQSGSSVRGKTRMAKTGNARLRKALYWPAIVAMTHNPAIHALKLRLQQAGKANMAIIGAAMRKLLHIVYGVLKSGLPFNPNIHLSA